jgi:hypothetical protein
VLACFLGVGGNRFIRQEVAIALDRKTEFTSNGLQLGSATFAHDSNR